VSGVEAEVVLVQPAPELITPFVEKKTFPQTSQSPAVRLIEVIFASVELVIDTGLPLAITLEINSPTVPDDALSLVVVPTIPPVVGLKVTDVAVAAPNVGVTRVGEVDPTKCTVPVCPDKVVLTELLVAMIKSF
jgi:hypothetical protein